MDVINFLVENAEVILVALLGLLALAALVAKLTPNTTDDKVVDVFIRGANTLLDFVRARKIAKAASSVAGKVADVVKR